MHLLLKSTGIAAILSITAPLPALALDIENSMFGDVAREKGLDPYLLYAVALTESAQGTPAQVREALVSPHPYALRTPARGYYPETRDEAIATLNEILASGEKLVDVGLMQLNLRWNGHRVDAPADLLDPRTSLRAAADVLTDAMASAPNDIVLGIGRYYTWSDDNASRSYAERVLHYYRNLTSL